MASRRLEIIISSDGSIAVKELDKVGEEAEKTGGKVNILGKEFEGWAGVAKTAGAAVVAAVAAVGAVALQISDEYTEAFNKIRTTTGATGTQLDGLKGSLANLMGSGVTSSVLEGATAISVFNQRLGLSGPELEQVSRQALNLAAVTGSDVNEVVSTSADLFRRWGVAQADIPDHLDKIYRAAQLSGMSVIEINEVLTESASTFRVFGFNLDESRNMMVNLSRAGVSTKGVINALEEASVNFAQKNQEAMAAVEEATAQVAQASNNLRKAQQNLYDLEERLAVQRAINSGDMKALARAQEAIAESRERAADAEEDSLDKINDAQQNLLDLRERLAEKGKLDVGDEQALTRAQDAIREAQSLDKVAQAEEALVELRERLRGKRRDIGDRQALEHAEEAITKAKEDQAKRVADANQALIDLQDRLGKRTDLSVSDQQSLRKATESITDAQEDQAESRERSAKDIARAEENLVDLQEQLSEKTQLSIGDQQALRRAHDSVAEAQQQLGVASGNLAKAQAAAAAAPKTLRESLKQLFDEIKNAPNDLVALEKAFQLFGEEATPQLVDDIRSGRLTFEDLFKPPKGMEDTKNLINETAEATRTWQDRLKEAWNDIKAMFGPWLANTLGGIVSGFKGIGNAANWLGEQWAKLEPVAKPVLELVGGMLGGLIEKIEEMYNMLFSKQEFLDSFLLTLKVLGGIVGGLLIGAFFLLGLAIAAVIIVITTIVTIITMVIWALGELMKAIGWVAEHLDDAWNWMAEQAGKIWNWITEAAGNAIRWIVDKADTMWDAISGVANSIGGAFTWAWDKIAGGADWLWDTLVGGFNWFINTMGKIPGWIWDGLNGMWDIVWKGFKSAINYVIDMWNNLHFPSITVGGVKIGGWDLPNIPKFHGGGVFDAEMPGGEGLALLRDNERVLTPSQAMSSSSVSAREPAMAGGPEIHVHVNGVLVHDQRAMGKYLAGTLAEFKRTGGKGPWSN